MQTSATFQDFNLLNRLVTAKGKDIGTDNNSLAFMPLVLEMLLNINIEEAEDSITDIVDPLLKEYSATGIDYSQPLSA